MIELFKKTYQDGAEVYLNPKEKDELIEYIKSLEQDNERLNKDATHLIELHKKTVEEKDKLQQRINKTIEYINKEFVFSDGTLGEADVKLLDILKGSDKE